MAKEKYPSVFSRIKNTDDVLETGWFFDGLCRIKIFMKRAVHKRHSIAYAVCALSNNDISTQKNLFGVKNLILNSTKTHLYFLKNQRYLYDYSPDK
jgi:hypothetical protein